MRERERERERETVTSLNRSMPVCVCVCVCVRERERERERDDCVTSQQSVQRVRNRLNRGLFANTSSMCLSRDSVPLSGLN